MFFFRFWSSFWKAFWAIWRSKNYTKNNAVFGTHFGPRSRSGGWCTGGRRTVDGRSRPVKTARKPPRAAPDLSKKGSITTSLQPCNPRDLTRWAAGPAIFFLIDYHPREILPGKSLASKKCINFEPPFAPGQDVFVPRYNFHFFLNSTDGVVPWSCPRATLVTNHSKSILRPGTHNTRVVPKCFRVAQA